MGTTRLSVSGAAILVLGLSASLGLPREADAGGMRLTASYGMHVPAPMSPRPAPMPMRGGGHFPTNGWHGAMSTGSAMGGHRWGLHGTQMTASHPGGWHVGTGYGLSGG